MPRSRLPPKRSERQRQSRQEMAAAVWEWGQYLGPEALEKGVSVCTSSWNRMAPNTFPFLAKAGGNYLNSQLVKMEAKVNGYDEGIVLGTEGLVSEGSGENIFVIRNGTIYTPASSFSILPGITRDSVLTLARHWGVTVAERPITIDELMAAHKDGSLEEIFGSGTAAVISPVSQLAWKDDVLTVGEGKVGPVAEKLYTAITDIQYGRAKDPFGWIVSVEENQ